MAGEQNIANSAQDVRIKIGEFAAKLREIHDELGGRIDTLASADSGLWIGTTPPTDLAAFSGWVNTTNETVDFLYNAGTLQAPDWVSILSQTKRPGTFGVPYKTTESINGRQVWAVDLSLGNLPNKTLKLVSIPASVLTSWGTTAERWIDVGSSYAFSNALDKVVSLPYSTLLEGVPDVVEWDQDAVYLEGDIVLRKGDVYRAKWYTQDDKPDKNDGPYEVWENLGPSETADIPRLYNVSDMIDVYIDSDMLAVRTTSNRTGYQGRVTLKYLLAQ